ncbi:MAG: orotidine-5'-phosphate decarboxylase [Patescibacteria group bacterium]
MESIEPAEPYYPPAAPGIEKIRNRWIEIDSMAGLGIDPDLERIPAEIWEEVGGAENVADGITLFAKGIIDATADLVVDMKPNPVFFKGSAGRLALANTFAYMKEKHPGVLRVCDGKFAEVGHSAEKIADEIFGDLDADAVLLNPYLGFDAIEPFAKWKDKLVILCVNTSNPSAAQIQNLPLTDGNPLWKHILLESMQSWNYNGNIIPVMSATHPDNLIGIRDIVGDTPILLAGVGSQGGSVDETVPGCLDSQGYGLMIGASRAVLYPDVQAGETAIHASRRAALTLRDNINLAKAA